MDQRTEWMDGLYLGVRQGMDMRYRSMRDTAAAVDRLAVSGVALVQLEQVCPALAYPQPPLVPFPNQHLSEASRTLSASTQDLGPR